MLVLVLLGQRASLIPVHLHINVLDDLLEDLVVDVGEVLVELGEADAVLVLLEEANYVGLRALLDEVLVLPGLWVVNLDVGFGLNLPHEVHLLQLSNKDLIVSMLVLVHDTEEVVPVSFLVEHRAVVHVVFQHGEPTVLSGVDLS